LARQLSGITNPEDTIANPGASPANPEDTIANPEEHLH
jgi:hypothetical protein